MRQTARTRRRDDMEKKLKKRTTTRNERAQQMSKEDHKSLIRSWQEISLRFVRFSCIVFTICVSIANATRRPTQHLEQERLTKHNVFHYSNKDKL